MKRDVHLKQVTQLYVVDTAPLKTTNHNLIIMTAYGANPTSFIFKAERETQ